MSSTRWPGSPAADESPIARATRVAGAPYGAGDSSSEPTAAALHAEAPQADAPAERALESCPCPLCGSEKARSSRYRQGEMRIVRCCDCRLWRLSPRLSEADMQAVYAQADYFEGGASGYDSYASQEIPLRLTFRRLLDNLRRRGVVGGSVLDVGCGYGYFLQEAASHFSTRMGADYSAGALDRAAPHADRLFLGGVESIPKHLQFDCIVALHVVEHVYDPLAFVRSLFRRLKPGGRLVLAAPDMGSWWRPVMGRRWPSFKYPEHVVYYDRRTLRQLMSAADLVELQPAPYPHAFPLNLVLQKLGIPSLRICDGRAMWLPATTVAMIGRRPEAGSRSATA